MPAFPVDKLRSIVDALGYYSNGSNFSYRVYLKVEERENYWGGEGGGWIYIKKTGNLVVSFIVVNIRIFGVT